MAWNKITIMYRKEKNSLLPFPNLCVSTTYKPISHYLDHKAYFKFERT